MFSYIRATMKRFSISQLARLLDVRQHTIRTWERRYGLSKPERSMGNIRFYSIEELEKLLYFSFLKDQGSKIAALSQFEAAELKAMANTIESNTATLQRSLLSLIISLYKLDIDSFETILDESSKIFGYNSTIHNLIIPLLYRTDILSYKYSTADIHFAVTAIRKKIMTAIDQAQPAISNNKKTVLYLPKGEHYDLVLLYAYYQLKCQGYTVYYLGTNISIENLKEVIENKKPDELLVYCYELEKCNFDDPIQALNQILPDSKFTVVTAVPPVSRSTDNVKFTHLLNFYS